MKKSVAKKAFYFGILSSLMLLPTTSFSIDLFDTSTGFLVIPEVDVNGDTFYDDVTLKLDFAAGTFELVTATPKPDNISITPLDTIEVSDIKMDFMGCERSGRNEVTCYMKLTSLGGFDRDIWVSASHGFNNSDPMTKLYDDLGSSYVASEVSVANLQISGINKVNFIAGIPTLAKYKFSNFSPNASSVSLFQPEFETSNRTAFQGDFRNINF